MIVKSMNDREFALEVIRDYVDEMKNYIERAMINKKETREQLGFHRISLLGARLVSKT